MSICAPIPKIKSFKVGTEELDLDWLLKHEFEDIREASETLPAAMGWLGWQRAYYKEQLYLAEVEIKTIKGRLYHAYRTNGMEADGYAGKATETALEHAINVHPDLIEQHAKVGKFERIVSNINVYINALESKIDLVRTGEATHRRVSDQEPLTDEELENKAATKTKGEE